MPMLILVVVDHIHPPMAPAMKRAPERSTGGMLGSTDTAKPPRLALRTDRSGLTSRSARSQRFSAERSGGPRAIAQALYRSWSQRPPRNI